MRTRMLALVVVAAACQRGVPAAAVLDAKNDACAGCRMAVSDPQFAAQLVAPGENPRFFDDIGCLRTWVRKNPPPKGAVAYVADHRTNGWVRAAAAVYTRVDALQTPMNSHLVAHVDEASRDADPAAAGGTAVPATELFGPAGPPDGAR